MLFGVASKSEASLIFMKSICKMIVPRQEFNIMLETSFFSIWNSLRANFLGRSGSRAGKGRIACNYISGVWISASKKWNADWRRCISNDVIVLGLCFSVFVHIHTCFCFMLIGGNLTAQSMGSKLSFLFPPRHQSALESLLAATSDANECLSEEPTLKDQIPVCKFISIYLISIIWWLWKINF